MSVISGGRGIGICVGPITKSYSVAAGCHDQDGGMGTLVVLPFFQLLKGEGVDSGPAENLYEVVPEMNYGSPAAQVIACLSRLACQIATVCER